MKKKNKWAERVMVIALFLLAYMGTWMALSFGVPYFRVKMDPGNEGYFAATMENLAPVKFAASAAVGVVVALIPRTFGKSDGKGL